MQNPDKTPEILLTPADLARRWDRSPGYLANLRATGEGPKFITLSERVIRYRLADVEAFEARQARRSLADNGGDKAA
jgi:hypothetical protein